MAADGYASSWWARIYDQWNEDGGRRRWRDADLRYVSRHLTGVRGPILEAACGTGSILLPLLRAGHDMFGLDLSAPMLAQLRSKAAAQGARRPAAAQLLPARAPGSARPRRRAARRGGLR